MSPSATHMPPLNVQVAEPAQEDTAEDLGATILKSVVQRQERGSCRCRSNDCCLQDVSPASDKEMTAVEAGGR